jgi:hypothetical protein
MAERAGYSYRVFWAKTARSWPSDRQAAARSAIRALQSQGDFVPSLFTRAYRLDAVDASPHSGASLLALQQVLEALQDSDGETRDEG